jgi:hypothetical protein
VSWTEYNANTWTAAEVVSDVRRRARISDTDLDYTDDVILREATDKIWSIAARVEAQARDGRKTFAVSRTVTTDSVIASGANYVLPPMCSGESVSSILWVDASGSAMKLPYVSVDREAEYLGESGTPIAYSLLDREVKLYPEPTGVTGSLRIIYQRRHPALSAGTQTGTVTAIVTASAGTETKFSLSSGLGADVVPGSWVDVVGKRVPHGVHYADAIVTAVAGADYTVSVPYATMLAAADSTPGRNALQPSGTSYFVQLPLEMRSALTGLTAGAIMSSIGDKAEGQSMSNAAMAELDDISGFLATRTKGTKEKIINRSSLMRSRVRNNW